MSLDHRMGLMRSKLNVGNRLRTSNGEYFFYIKREVFLDVKMFETGQNVKMFLNGFRIALSAAVYEAEVAFSCHNTTITMIIMMIIKKWSPLL